MEKLEHKHTGCAIVLFMLLHAMFTGLLLVAMVHTQIRMGRLTEHIAKHDGEIESLREMLNQLIRVEPSSIQQKSAVESGRDGRFQYDTMESKTNKEEEEKVDEEEVEEKPLILRIKRTTKTKCCEKGGRGRKGQKGERGRRGRRGAKGDKGDTGDDGRDGRLGLKGQRGAKGNKGNKGERGDTGADGRDGQFGLKGQQGAKGNKGAKGETGLTGRDGRDGKDGQQGSQGTKGDKGEKGLPGMRAMFPESAHIVGQGKTKQLKNVMPNSHVYLLTSWVIKHKKGQMSYSHGYLRVGVQGYYYIYSQIYYRDGRSTMTGYMMYIDDKPALKASNSVISSSRRFNTNYMGGIFHLDAGQKISVRTFYRQEFYFSEETSYFGAFMIHQ